MTKDQAINKVLTLARNEIGYKEKSSNIYLDDKNANAGSGNYTKYARDLDAITNFYNGAKNGFAWCDIFVDWLFYKSFGAAAAMKMLCQPEHSAGAGCLYSAGYYQNNGCWTSIPAPGEQIFFSYSGGEVSHTGIVEQVNGQQVITIEGNTSDQVARRTYAVNDKRIYGYGIPRWEYATGDPTPIITDNPTRDTLRKGDVGEDVAELQEKLIKLGYSCGPDGADGDYGNNTFKAVKQFQKDNGLVQDGVAGPQTLKLIDSKLAPAPTPTPQPQPQPSTGERTYTVQPGDNLWKIAAKELGSGLKYTQIKKLNNLKSNFLTVGQVLKLP